MDAILMESILGYGKILIASLAKIYQYRYSSLKIALHEEIMTGIELGEFSISCVFQSNLAGSSHSSLPKTFTE